MWFYQGLSGIVFNSRTNRLAFGLNGDKESEFRCGGRGAPPAFLCHLGAGVALKSLLEVISLRSHPSPIKPEYAFSQCAHIIHMQIKV